MINQNYFESIDSENKAYFLGLIYADGCIYRNRLQLLLADEDNEVLHILHKEINPKSKIQHLSGKNERCKNYSIFSVHNKQIIYDLNNLGVTERKTYKELRIPKIDRELIKHFIRGFLDGDGFISYKGYYSIRKNGWKNYMFRKVIGFTNSSKLLLTDISNFLSEELLIDSGKFYITNGTGSKTTSYSLWFFRNNDLIKIVDFLYANSSIYFKRKFELSKFCKLTPREFRELTISKPRNA